MTADSKRPLKTFDLTGGRMPALKPAAAPRPGEPGALAGQVAPAAGRAVPGCRSQKELILAVIEAVKDL